MDRFELDRQTIDYMARLYKRGRLNLEPSYQRSKVWGDDLHYALIDSITQDFPIGLIMLNIVPHVDEDGTKIDKYEVVDGQQRMRTIIEYIDGASWTTSNRDEKFKPFTELSENQQARFLEYKIAVASMKEFELEEITECFNRLQKGKTLKIGEKLKSHLTSKVYDFVKELTLHRIFGLTNSRHKVRDAHWTLAAAFFKSLYTNDLLGRQEYKHLEVFFKSNIDKNKAKKALEECRKILNYEYKVLDEALKVDSEFEKYVQTARVLKWLFVCLVPLIKTHSLSGREHLVAQGVLNYYKAVAEENSPEWTAYLNTGRTGRIDSDEVRNCLSNISNYIITATDAQPLDPQRFFTPEQRKTIFHNSRGVCQECNMELSSTNFHADHIKPYVQGGPTNVSNGRALCSKCNRSKKDFWNELVNSGSV